MRQRTKELQSKIQRSEKKKVGASPNGAELLAVTNPTLVLRTVLPRDINLPTALARHVLIGVGRLII
jgi:hypothetical protein